MGLSEGKGWKGGKVNYLFFDLENIARRLIGEMEGLDVYNLCVCVMRCWSCLPYENDDMYVLRLFLVYLAA